MDGSASPVLVPRSPQPSRAGWTSSIPLQPMQPRPATGVLSTTRSSAGEPAKAYKVDRVDPKDVEVAKYMTSNQYSIILFVFAKLAYMLERIESWTQANKFADHPQTTNIIFKLDSWEDWRQFHFYKGRIEEIFFNSVLLSKVKILNDNPETLNVIQKCSEWVAYKLLKSHKYSGIEVFNDNPEVMGLRLETLVIHLITIFEPTIKFDDRWQNDFSENSQIVKVLASSKIIQSAVLAFFQEAKEIHPTPLKLKQDIGGSFGSMFDLTRSPEPYTFWVRVNIKKLRTPKCDFVKTRGKPLLPMKAEVKSYGLRPNYPNDIDPASLRITDKPRPNPEPTKVAQTPIPPPSPSLPPYPSLPAPSYHSPVQEIRQSQDTTSSLDGQQEITIEELKKKLQPSFTQLMVKAFLNDMETIRKLDSRLSPNLRFFVKRETESLSTVEPYYFDKIGHKIMSADELFHKYLGHLPGSRAMYNFLITKTAEELDKVRYHDKVVGSGFDLLRRLEEGRTYTFSSPIEKKPWNFKELLPQSECMKFHAYELVRQFHERSPGLLEQYASVALWQ